jgi:hypothetical protein
MSGLSGFSFQARSKKSSAMESRPIFSIATPMMWLAIAASGFFCRISSAISAPLGAWSSLHSLMACCIRAVSFRRAVRCLAGAFRIASEIFGLIAPEAASCASRLAASTGCFRRSSIESAMGPFHIAIPMGHGAVLRLTAA